MLYRIIISPSLFSDGSMDEAQASHIQKCIYELFNDALKNGVFLVASKEATSVSVRDSLASWPQKSKKKAKMILMALTRQNRFVEKEILRVADDTFRYDGCGYIPGLVQTYAPALVVLGNGCCISSILSSAKKTLKIGDYRSFEWTEGTQEEIRASEGKYTKEKFEKDVLIPIFRDCKHVKLIDRFIGRSQVSGPIRSAKLKEFRSDYQKSIEWIVEVFDRETAHRKYRSFTIYTGIKTAEAKKDFSIRELKERTVSEFRESLQQLQDSMDEKYDFPVRVVGKKESSKQHGKLGLQMSHDRYLITDQFSISVGRGFDLFFSDTELQTRNLSEDNLKDFHIYRTLKKFEIEREVRKLPAL